MRRDRQRKADKQLEGRTDGLRALYISIEKMVFMAIKCGRQQ